MGKTILVVDDHQPLRESLRALLLEAMPDCSIIEAADGEEAIEFADTKSPDIVIMDIGLPGIDGIETTKIIHARKPELKVVMLSMYEEDNYRQEAKLAGASDYVLKRTMHKDLMPAVKRALKEAEELMEQKKAHEKLSEFEAKYKSVVDNISIGISVIGPNMEILDMNKQMKKWYPDIDVADRPLCYHVFNSPPKEDACSYCPTCNTLRDGQVHEAVTATPAGNVLRHYRIISSPVKNADGTISSAIEIVEDITERLKAETELRNSEREYKELFNSTLDGVYQVDAEGKFTVMNHAGAQILGCESPDEIIGTNILEYWRDPKDREAFIVELNIKKRVRGYHIRAKKRNGELIELEASSRIIEDENSNFLGVEGILRDVTERMRAEEALRASERQYRQLVDNALVGVYRATPEGNFLYANYALANIFECENSDEMLRLPVRMRYKRPEDRETFLNILKERGKVPYYEIDVPTKTGKLKTIVISAVLEGGFITGMIIDITERKHLEAQLRQAQKMEAIGTLAGGIAHDFNNILTAIIGYGHVILMKMAKDNPQRLNIQHILDACDKAAHLTKDLLLFSRKQISDRKPVDLNGIIRTVEKFLVRVIGEDIAFKTILYDGSIPVLADVHQLEQVLMNLATNSRDAMPKGGILTIATEQIMLDKEFVTIHGYGKPGMCALITVADTGKGMDEDTRRKIFEPFFTTKEVGKGTGLGMAVVYGIIKQHEGYINVYSEPGKGTTFRIYLPVIAAEIIEEKKEAQIDYPEKGTETLLVAEDDESLRELTVSVLQEFGYEVIVAVDGEDAVKKYIENKDRIQLLLFDIVMPKKTGKEAYDEIKRIKPDIRVIFLSGYAPDIIRQKALLENKELVAYKPISPADLLKKVRNVLN